MFFSCVCVFLPRACVRVPVCAGACVCMCVRVQVHRQIESCIAVEYPQAVAKLISRVVSAMLKPDDVSPAPKPMTVSLSNLGRINVCATMRAGPQVTHAHMHGRTHIHTHTLQQSHTHTLTDTHTRRHSHIHTRSQTHTHTRRHTRALTVETIPHMHVYTQPAGAVRRCGRSLVRIAPQ